MPLQRTKGAVVKQKLGFAIAVGLLAVALGLTLTACGGNGDSDGVASLSDTNGQSTNGSQGSNGSGGTSAGDREQAALAYARCMREHGVDFPDPVNGRFEFKNQRGDQRKLEEAQKACQDILQAAAPQLSEEQEAEMREAAVEFAKCMREHGVDMPDPKFPEGGGVLMRMPRGSEDDPDFQEAQKACQSILNEAQPDGPAMQGRES
jgi:hypothetical protein